MAGDNAKIDDNRTKTLLAASSADETQIVRLLADPDTNRLLVNSTVTGTVLSKPTDAYGISNIEDTGTYKYYGFEDKDGNWYILRKTLATNIYLYAAGASDYSTAWTNRASQTYASYAVTF